MVKYLYWFIILPGAFYNDDEQQIEACEKYIWANFLLINNFKNKVLDF